MSLSTPIIFVHKRKSWYLPYTLLQAASVSENSDVTLLYDGENIVANPRIRVTQLDKLHSSMVTKFGNQYHHMSTNSRDYELFCWLRWFYLLSYMELENIPSAFYLDSDVLIFRSTDYLLGNYSDTLNKCAFMIPQQSHSSYRWAASGHISYWTQEALKEFCNFALDTFLQQEWLNMYRQKWSWDVENKKPGGICDMVALYLFWREYNTSITNLCEEYGDGTFDHNFNSASNFLEDEYELQNGHKAVNFLNGKPIFFKAKKKIFAHAIHFQGMAKKYIPVYYRGPWFKEQLEYTLDRMAGFA